jgi:hypothetical protein
MRQAGSAYRLLCLDGYCVVTLTQLILALFSVSEALLPND